MPRIYSLLLLLLLILTNCSKKPDPYSESLLNSYFKNINSKSLSDSTRVAFIDSTYIYALNIKNDSIGRNTIFSALRAYFKLNQNEKFLSGSRKLLQLSTYDGDTLHMAKALMCIGDYYEDTVQLDSAFTYYSKSEKLFKYIGGSVEIGKVTLYKAGILYEAGIFTESEIQTATALRYLIQSDSDRLIYETYNLMGLNLTELGNYEKALDYYNLAFEKLEAMEKLKYSSAKLIKSRASIHNNIGNVYLKKGVFSKAIFHYKKCLLSPIIKYDYPILYAMATDNLAFAMMKQNSLQNVEALFLESITVRDSLKISSGMVTGQIHLGAFYLNSGDTTKALLYFKDGLKKAKEIKSTYDIKNALELLSLNDKQNRVHYSTLYINITDSLQNIERNTRNKFARIAYETDQIEEKNESLLKKYSSTVLIFSGAFLLLSVIFIIYRLKARNRELHYIKNQQDSNEKIYQLILEQKHENQTARHEERNRIALELHDGIVNRVFATRFNLTLLQPGESDQKAQLVQELVTVEEEIRKVSHDLQQNLAFEDTSFQKALVSLVLNQTNAMNTQFDCSIDTYIHWSLVPSAYKVHIYRICQEALHNVNKYAQSTKCFVFLLKKGSNISLQITDNGVGFDLQKKKQGIGLKNMQQRAKSIKGSFSIISDSSGTTIEILF